MMPNKRTTSEARTSNANTFFFYKLQLRSVLFFPICFNLLFLFCCLFFISSYAHMFGIHLILYAAWFSRIIGISLAGEKNYHLRVTITGSLIIH